jgi:hypothetical protein
VKEPTKMLLCRFKKTCGSRTAMMMMMMLAAQL